MGKELRSKKMRSLLAHGKRKARGHPPAEGYMKQLVYETLPNGWHYQVDWVHDVRVAPKPYVVAWGFHPRTRGSQSAQYYLMEQHE